MRQIQIKYPRIKEKLGIWRCLMANARWFFIMPIFLILWAFACLFGVFILLFYAPNLPFFWVVLAGLSAILIGIFVILRKICQDFSNYRQKIFRDIVLRADKGYEHAQYLLAAAFELGICVPKNPQKALFWYQKSAGKNGYGNPLAMQALGLAYHHGKYIRQNPLLAYQYLLWASDCGICDYPEIFKKYEKLASPK